MIDAEEKGKQGKARQGKARQALLQLAGQLEEHQSGLLMGNWRLPKCKQSHLHRIFSTTLTRIFVQQNKTQKSTNLRDWRQIAMQFFFLQLQMFHLACREEKKTHPVLGAVI